MDTHPARNTVLDAIKGVAILLVVLGHALQSHLYKPDDSVSYRIIYSFHMPLFMLLSGWTAKPETAGRVSKTLIRLLPPTLSWYTIKYFVEKDYKTGSYLTYIIDFCKNPEVGLWFLWVLAFCVTSLVFCRSLEERVGGYAYLFGVASLIALPISYYGVPLMKMYFPYLLIGYLLSRFASKSRWLIPHAVALSAIVYPIVFPLWHRTYAQTGNMGFHYFTGHHIPIQAIAYIATKFVEGCAGSIIASFIAFVLYNGFHLTMLSWLGRRTLEIYVSHQLFIHLFPSATVAAIIEVFLVALIGSIVLAVILERFRILALLLYGRPSKAMTLRLPTLQSTKSAVRLVMRRTR